MTKTSQPTEPTDEDLDVKILYGFAATIREDADEPVFEVFGNPTPQAILALAEDAVVRSRAGVEAQAAHQLALIMKEVVEVKERINASAGSSDAILALLGKLVMKPDSTTGDNNPGDNNSGSDQ